MEGIVAKAAENFKKVGAQVVLETPEKSVSLQLKVVDELKPSDNGLLLAHTGGEFKL